MMVPTKDSRTQLSCRKKINTKSQTHMKKSISGYLTAFVTVLSASLQLNQPCLAEGKGIAGPVVDGLSALIAPITASFGTASIKMALYRYEYSHTTHYRGVSSSENYVAQVDKFGNSSFRKTIEMTGIDAPLKITATNAFSISIGGSDGEIPFCVRKHKCEMNLGNSEIYSVTTDANIIFQVVHKYKVNPSCMSPFTTALIACTAWDKERIICDPIVGKTTELITCTVANNGVSYASIPNGRVLNMSHGNTSGIGITW
jgi:hypothetical protein